MPRRASWRGFLNISLVSVPVKAYNASSSGSQVRPNQRHALCNSRIEQQTVCPLCGDIALDEIVKENDYAKDQYVVIDVDEREKLRTEDEGKSIRISAFVRPEQIDPVHYSDTNFFLVPDGSAGQKSYKLLHETMRNEELQCVANVVLHKKEQPVLVRPTERVLCMTVLKCASQVELPAAFDDEIDDSAVSEDEYALAKSLVEQNITDDFDLSQFLDATENVTALIEAKVKGEELVSPPAVETPQVLKLMDALDRIRSFRRRLREFGHCSG